MGISLYIYQVIITININSLFPVGATPFSIGPSCDDGTKWQLCSDACKKASCTNNPDAKCVAPLGGCGPDACKPKFYNSMGKEVQCKLCTPVYSVVTVINSYLYLLVCVLSSKGVARGVPVVAMTPPLFFFF